MREVIEQLINDKFHTEYGNLELSCPKIELNLKIGAIKRCSFQMSADGEIAAKGTLHTTSLRIRLERTEFEGSQQEIFFYFDTTGMDEGDTCNAEIHLVTNYGEVTLPVVVTIEPCSISTSLGNIKNLFHFANLAKFNWLEAVQVFYSKEFVHLFSSNDQQYLSAYTGLSRTFGNQKNLNEFLILINKKQKMEFSIEKMEFFIENTGSIQEEHINISRSGWGYIDLDVSVEGEFISVIKEQLSDEDFLGNQCTLDFYIHPERLHSGNNYGTITISNLFYEFKVGIVVGNEWKNTPELRKKLEIHNLNFQLINEFVRYRIQKISILDLMKMAAPIIERMVILEGNIPIYRLYQAHLLIGEERYNEAQWVLNHADVILSKGQHEPEVICYYLYLNTLIDRQISLIDHVTSEVRKHFMGNSSSWKIAWILLYLEEEYAVSPSKKWMFIEEMFEHGCTSPIMYAEAYQLLKNNPTLLRKMDGFELQVLHFAQKNDILNEDIISQIHYQVNRIRNYSETMLKILESCYEKKAEIETLSAICSLLISGNKTESEYFHWYEKAVEKNLRITNLYEYFMMSIDIEQQVEIPKMILMYFAYKCDLSYERKAYLYTYLLKNEDKFREILPYYKDEMEKFVLNQVRKGHFNDKLVYLYKTMINPVMVDEEIAYGLVPLIFQHTIRISNPGIRYVVILYNKMKEEMKFPVIRGTAHIAIYSNDFRILLEDGKMNRYIQTISYEILNPQGFGKLLSVVNPFIHDFLEFDLHCCEGNRSMVSINDENASRYLNLCRSERIAEHFKKDIRLKLATFYYENDRIRETDEFLECLDPGVMDSTERADLLEYLVLRGMYDKALDWIKNYGMERVSPKTSVRLCQNILGREEFYFDRDLLSICHQVFREGKYDDTILLYLMEFFHGSTREMRDLWKASRNFSISDRRFIERLLIQILFTGSYIGEKYLIFNEYIKEGADTKILLAYLYQTSYEFFVLGRLQDDSFYEQIHRYYRQEKNLPLVCKLAFLKYYSEKVAQTTKEELHTAECFIKDLQLMGMEFAFFQDYIPFVPGISHLLENTIIEYRGKSGSKVMIHYVLEKEDDGNEYKKEEMKDMFGGIFVKSFILFFGETLQYYITENNEYGEQLTESGTISKSNINYPQKENRFNILNDMVISKTLQDYETFNTLLEEYYKKKFFVEHIFSVL